MFDVMEQFGITLASAATHYNHAFKTVKELNAELVDGLGRAEDKKGGRKPKQATAVEAVAEYVEPVQTEFNVCKKSDGTVVATGLSFEAAQELINKAAAQKKAKLYFV